MKLSDRDYQRLKGVHPDLVKVVEKAAEDVVGFEFFVIEGLRTKDRQRLLVKKGASMTMNSRHLTGHAVDLAVKLDGRLSWDWPMYHKLAAVVKQSAEELGVEITWGGDWKTFKDGPHFELSWEKYPAEDS